MRHRGYQLTEWAYSHPWLTPEAKLVLGVTLQWPERNPSIRQLADVLPLNKDAIILGQAELELEGVARYDRPTKRRGKTDLRFEDSNRLAWVHPKTEPNRRRQDAERGAFLPAAVAERLPRGVRGKKNGKLFPLVALVYAHEQARAGRVAIQDDAVGATLGLNPRQVRTIRQQLIEAGVLVKAEYVPRLGKSYRLIGVPAPDVKFDPGKVRRASLLHGAMPNPSASILTVASKYELAYFLTLLDQLDAEARADVVAQAQHSEGGATEAFGIGATALIDAAKRHLPRIAEKAPNDRSKDHQVTVLGNVPLVPSSSPRGTGVAPQKNTTTRPSGASRRKTHGREELRRQPPQRRLIVPEFNLYLRADDATFSAMTDGLRQVEAKYGREERAGFAREWVLASAGSGKTFLTLMYARFPWLKPREQTEPRDGVRNRRAELDAMLAELPGLTSAVTPG
jgi:hypothetical protein